MIHFMDYKTIGTQQYYISTVYTFDNGWETMVFESENKAVISWKEKYQKLYPNGQKAAKGHNYVLFNLEECLANYKG